MSKHLPATQTDREIPRSALVSVGIRVAIQALFDDSEGGDSQDEFLHQLRSVPREQPMSATELALDSL